MIGARMGRRRGPKFFDPNSITGPQMRASHKALTKFGAFVRRDARKSIKKARMKRLDEMTTPERQRYHIARAYYKEEGGPRPRRPLKASMPRRPPRSIQGLLKKLIYFHYEPRQQNVVIGPEAAAKKAARVIEEGGVVTITVGPNRGQQKTMEERPYMGPAFRKNLPNLPSMWHDSIRPA